MKEKEFIPALSYDFLTGIYDWTIARVMPSRFREKLLGMIAPRAGDSILDFGTGTGDLAMMIKGACPGAQVTGIDVDPKVLRFASKKTNRNGRDIKLISYEGLVLPFPDGVFDAVTSCLVFHHLPRDDKRKMLSEIHRVLKPGGKLFIADWGLERNRFKAKLVKYLRHITPLRHARDNALGMLPQFMADAGLNHIRELTYTGTVTGTLSYYRAEKEVI